MQLLLGLAALSGLVFGAVGQAAAQTVPQLIEEGFFGGALLEYDAFNTYNPASGEGEVDVYYSFVYDILQFVRAEGDTYRARYEVSALLRRGKKEYVDFKSDVGTVVVTSYPETNSRIKRISGRLRLQAPPGKYELELRLTDGESEKTLVRKKKILVRDFHRKGVHLSDMIFADSAACERLGSGRWWPNLSARYTQPESGFVAIVQVVPEPDTQTVETRWEIRTQAGKKVAAETTRVKGYRSLCLGLHDYVRRPGRYELRIQARTAEYKAEAKRVFSVAWGEAFVDTANLDVIIEAMRYIAKTSDIERMRQASPSMRRLLFEDFWKERDPTPDTPENELREEFFRRLDFANRFFSVPELGLEGWQTDRGKIYIIYGHPTHVEREPAQMQQASYEIWYYSHLRRRFVFVDETGSGLYELKRAD